MQCLLYISRSDHSQLGENCNTREIHHLTILLTTCLKIRNKKKNTHTSYSTHVRVSSHGSTQTSAATAPKLAQPCCSPCRKQDACSLSNHEGILTVMCIWAPWSQRDERHVCGTLRSIISCSSCTMSSLRLSCRVDILCSSSSLRCLTEGTSRTTWWYHNVTSIAKCCCLWALTYAVHLSRKKGNYNMHVLLQPKQKCLFWWWKQAELPEKS